MKDWTKARTSELIVEIMRVAAEGGDDLVQCSEAASELDSRIPASEENSIDGA